MKKAFTLIELLVVIAIIAILAAILFPVFAQAKMAAKKTVALSNMKQLGTATFIYMGDVDDRFPKTYYGFPDGCAWGNGNQVYYNWRYAINPYTKSKDLLTDPTNPFQGKTGTQLGMRKAYEDNANHNNDVYMSQNYAVNGNIIGFANGPCGGQREGIDSNTNLDDVAGTILMSPSRTRWNDTGPFFMSPDPKYGGYNYWCLPTNPTNDSGALNCPAAGNGAIHAIGKQTAFAFADGHAKTMNPLASLQTNNDTFDNWYQYALIDGSTGKPFAKSVLRDVAAKAYPEYK